MRKKQQARKVRRQTLTAMVRGFFRTRQIYVRSRHDVHYMTFTPVAQMSLLVLFLAGLFWMAYASVNIVFKDQLLELKQQKLFEARLDHEHQLAEMRAAIEKANDRLLLNQQAYLKKIDEVKMRFDELTDEQKRMHEYFRKGWVPLKPASASDAPGVEGALSTFFSQRYAADFRSETEVLAPLAEMDRSFSELQKEHLAMLQDGMAYAQRKFERSAQIMKRVGVAVPTLPASTGNDDATGGPYLPASGGLSQIDTDIGAAMAALDGTLRHNDHVVDAVSDFPLRLPMTEISRISSEFGYRSDPMRRTLALHGGVDFVAPYGSPVLATSAGRVVWAGLHGPYGNLVEIQHDNGVSTRYGHLRGVNVSLGRQVEAGDVIGWLGNTGRSTGPHLHYETRVSDHAIDPQEFWRIRNDLQTLKDNNKQ